MFLFRGDVPRKEFAATLPPALRAGFRLVGPRFLREYPFEEAYFKPLAAQFRDALAMPLILLGGINRLDTMTEGSQTASPSWRSGGPCARARPGGQAGPGESRESLCIHCNKCMPTIYRGTHCVLVPPADRPGLRILPAGSAR